MVLYAAFTVKIPKSSVKWVPLKYQAGVTIMLQGIQNISVSAHWDDEKETEHYRTASATSLWNERIYLASKLIFRPGYIIAVEALRGSGTH